MPRINIILAAVALALLGNPCSAQLYPLLGVNSYTNPLNALDVDNNGLVQPRDVNLVINCLDALHDAKSASLNPAQAAALLASAPASSPPYFWDTNRDGVITPNDALLVINRLNNVSIIPEPSTIVMASMGLLALCGCAWRRMRRSSFKPNC